MSEDKSVKFLKTVSAYILRFLMFILVAGMLLGSIQLLYTFIQSIMSPPVGLIEVHELYSFFSLILIIAVGYELLKSMVYVIDNSQIPVRAILKIAMIAVANKVITLDVHEVPMGTMIGISVLVTSLGLGYFLHHFKSKDLNDLND